MAPLSHIIPPGQPSDEGSAFSPDTSSSNTRLTPDSDGDSDLETGELGESFRLQRRGPDVEKKIPEEDDEDEEPAEYEERGRRGHRASVSTTHSFQLYTPDEEHAVVRKFDRNLVLFVALLYMLSFLDRSSEDAFLRTKLRC